MIVFPDAPERPLQFILQRKGARTLKEADQWSVYANPIRRRGGVVAAPGGKWDRVAAGSAFRVVRGRDRPSRQWMDGSGPDFHLTVGSGALDPDRGQGAVCFRVNWTGSWKRTVWDLHRLGGLRGFGPPHHRGPFRGLLCVSGNRDASPGFGDRTPAAAIDAHGEAARGCGHCSIADAIVATGEGRDGRRAPRGVASSVAADPGLGGDVSSRGRRGRKRG